MKVKNIILMVVGIMLVIFIIIPSINLIFAHNLRYSKPDISEKLFEVNSRYPSSFGKDESLYNLSEIKMDGFGRYNIFMQARIGNSLIDKDDITQVIENYEKILSNHPRSSYYELSYQGILDSYIYLGDSKNLTKWIKWGSSKDNEDINKISSLYKSYNHFVNREYDLADKILGDYSLGDEELDYIYYFLKGHIEFMKENFDKALEYYGNAEEVQSGNERSFFGNYPPIMRKDWLEGLGFNEGEHKISGRVTVDGVGIPFIEIYLQNPRDPHSSRGGNFVAITDKNGYFETIKIKDRGYEIGIGIGTPVIFDNVYKEKEIRRIDLRGDMEFNFEFTQPMKIISPGLDEEPKDGKFTVEWEAIREADYYTIHSIGYKDLESNFGTNIRFPIYDENGEEEIRNTKAIFDIEDLNNYGSGIMYTGEEDGTKEAKLTPQGVLGYFGPGSNMTIFVNAYDKEGNLLNSSLPIISYSDDLPSIKVPGEDFSEGEKLILDRKYEESIDYYEEVLMEDENNTEALKYLYRLYYYNYYQDEDKQEIGIDYGIRFYEIVGKDKFLRMLEDIKAR